jgi:hypothetical protein
LIGVFPKTDLNYLLFLQIHARFTVAVPILPTTLYLLQNSQIPQRLSKPDFTANTKATASM